MGPALAERATEPLTLACALAVEEHAARKGGARTARIGLAASLPAPDGPLASFGLAGALVPDLPPGSVVTATRIVDENGAVLWAGEPLAVPGARAGVLCGASRVVDHPEERAALAARTGALALDLESAALARTGRLAGAVRAISDDATVPLGRLARAATPDGRVAWPQVVAAFVIEPARSTRAARAARRGIAALEGAAAALAGGGRP